MPRKRRIAYVIAIAATILVGSRAMAHRPGPAVSFAQFDPTPVSTVPIVRWYWHFGDPSTGAANISTEQNPVHRFSHAKTYTVTLTVWDANGNSDSSTRYVDVVR